MTQSELNPARFTVEVRLKHLAGDEARPTGRHDDVRFSFDGAAVASAAARP
jgi:hypothetical protein